MSQDLLRSASVGEEQILTDLGFQPPGGLTPGLLQDYMERRTPLGDHRLLTMMGYLMCHAYEVGPGRAIENSRALR